MGQQSNFTRAVSGQITLRSRRTKSFIAQSFIGRILIGRTLIDRTLIARLIGTGTAISMSMGITMTSQAADIPDIPITVTNHQCEPMHLTVPQGKVRFIVKNQSMRALEWEILNGVMVVAERENIAPGFYQKMTVDLEPGQYQTTCGLLTNPRGTLTVQSNQKQSPYQLKAADTVAIAAEYKFYLILTSQSLAAAHDATGKTSETATTQAYYALLAMANAWTAQDTQDRYQAGHTDPQKRHQQISAWQKAAHQHTLSVTEILTQLQHSLNQIALGPDRAAGLLTDVNKFITLAKPVLRKMDTALVERIDADLTQWQTADTQAMRHTIAEDLKRMTPYFQQEQ